MISKDEARRILIEAKTLWVRVNSNTLRQLADECEAASKADEGRWPDESELNAAFAKFLRAKADISA